MRMEIFIIVKICNDEYEIVNRSKKYLNDILQIIEYKDR